MRKKEKVMSKIKQTFLKNNDPASKTEFANGYEPGFITINADQLKILEELRLIDKRLDLLNEERAEILKATKKSSTLSQLAKRKKRKKRTLKKIMI